MSTTAPLEVKVIYDASTRGRRSRAVRAPRVRRSRPIALIVLGVLNITAAGAAYYATWWQADSFIYMKLVLHSPIPGMKLSDVDDAFARTSAASPTGIAVAVPDAAGADKTGPRFRGALARNILGVTAYVWLTLATAAGCALALSAGSLFGRAGGGGLRRIGLILLVGLVLALAFWVYQTLAEYGREYPPKHLRLGMGGLVALACTVGTAIGTRTLGLTRLAAGVVILAGVGSAVALYLGYLCGAFPPEQATLEHLGLVFVAASAWGWLLLVIGARIAR